jgi:hypothetical protein
MRTRVKRSVYITGTVVLLLVLSVMAGCWATPRTEVERLLSEAKLSPLPPSATNIAYHQWNGIFTGETYAKFELSPSDLRGFVANSPSLQGIAPKKIYDTNYQHVPYPPRGGELDIEHCDYFSQRPVFPSWYDLTVRGKGKKFIIDWGPNMMILIDEDKNIVWLHLVKG